jgi:hypothetical protein
LQLDQWSTAWYLKFIPQQEIDRPEGAGGASGKSLGGGGLAFAPELYPTPSCSTKDNFWAIDAAARKTRMAERNDRFMEVSLIDKLG